MATTGIHDTHGGIGWVLPPPPPSNSWIVIIWLYIALNRTPSVDCYWGVGAVPKV